VIAFHFRCPVQVRYVDIDQQGHVNNAVYFTYMEHGRYHYMRKLGLWEEVHPEELALLLVHAECTYRAPIQLGQQLQAAVAAVRLGTRSFDLAYRLESDDGGRLFAEGRTVQVMFDTRRQRTVMLPERWRQIIQQYEGQNPG
jgi:acyl-CoA thioester hydrolase